MDDAMNAPVKGLARTSIPVGGGALPLTFARGKGTGAVVVLVPSAFGVTADLEVQLEELASASRRVVTFDPFFRGDAGPAEYGDLPRVMARLQALDRSQAQRDLRAAIDWAREREADSPVVVVGVCFGGPFALLAAADGAASAVVTWHGTRIESYLDQFKELRCPLRLHFGSVDPVVPPQAVEAIREAFARHPDARVIVHEGATHGFSHRGAPQAHHAAAERAAMASVLELVTRLAT